MNKWFVEILYSSKLRLFFTVTVAQAPLMFFSFAAFSFLYSSTPFLVTAINGDVITLAGTSDGFANGIGTNAKFRSLHGISCSPIGNFALVVDYHNHLIRQIDLSTTSVTTLAGSVSSSGSANGIGTNSKFNYPTGVSISPDSSFALVADYYNNLIRHIVLSTVTVTTLAGVTGSTGAQNGLGTNAKFNYPTRVSISPNHSFALVADYYNSLIRHIVLTTASVTTLAGAVGSAGFVDGYGTNAKFNFPYAVSLSPDGLLALVADYSNNRIRQIDLSTILVTTLAGTTSSGSTNGVGTQASFYYPMGVTISPDSSVALIAEYQRNLIRRVVLTSASVTTLAGGGTGSTNGIGTNALFSSPYDVSLSADGSYALVTDNFNDLIRKVSVSSLEPKGGRGGEHETSDPVASLSSSPLPPSPSSSPSSPLPTVSQSTSCSCARDNATAASLERCLSWMVRLFSPPTPTNPPPYSPPPLLQAELVSEGSQLSITPSLSPSPLSVSVVERGSKEEH
jgi:hypothetical protein